MSYLIDTSSLICLFNKYPEEVFGTLYPKFNNEINNGNIKAPLQVLNELKRGDDTAYKWIKTYRKIFFISLNNKILQKSVEIIDKYPELTKNLGLTSTGNDPADPYLIAMAAIQMEENIDRLSIIKIITEEGNKKNHIPEVSGKYGIDCINILDFFKEMKWRF